MRWFRAALRVWGLGFKVSFEGLGYYKISFKGPLRVPLRVPVVRVFRVRFCEGLRSEVGPQGL